MAETEVTQSASKVSADAQTPTQEAASQPFGFMNEACGFAFVGDSDEINSAETVFVNSLWPIFALPSEAEMHSNTGVVLELAFPSTIDVSPNIGSLSEVWLTTAWVDNQRENDALSLGSKVVCSSIFNTATPTRDCANTNLLCHSKTCSRYIDFEIDHCVIVGETTICR